MSRRHEQRTQDTWISPAVEFHESGYHQNGPMENAGDAAVVPRELIEAYWDDFTEEELDWIDGRVNRIYLALVDKHGISRDEAAGQLRRFCQERVALATQA